MLFCKVAAVCVILRMDRALLCAQKTMGCGK